MGFGVLFVTKVSDLREFKNVEHKGISAMKNSVVCVNCQHENPNYEAVCGKCKSFLRDRVANIDFWTTLARIAESPVNGFLRIIYSEQKNFSLILIILASLQFTVFSFIAGGILENRQYEGEVTLNFIPIILLIFLGFVMLYPLIMMWLAKLSGIKLRYMDTFALIAYSFLPYAFLLAVIFPVTLVLFGPYLFTFDPSPFILKPVPGYILTGINIIFVLLSIFLSISGFYSQSKSAVFSFISGILLHTGLFSLIILTPSVLL